MSAAECENASTCNTILPENENAYKKRYGNSLQKMADINRSYQAGDYDELISWKTVVTEPAHIPSDVRMCICIGFADGSYLQQLLNSSSAGLKFFVYEPEISYFLHVCSIRNISELIENERVELVVDSDDNDHGLATAIHRVMGVTEVRHLYGLYLPGYQKLCPGILDKVITVVNDCVGPMMAEANTSMLYGRHIFYNSLAALSLLRHSILSGQLFDAVTTRNIPVILVGAGPSLEKNAEYLKMAKGKALIIACTRATETLKEKGIVPDLVAMIDMLEGHDYCAHDEALDYRMMFMAQSAKDVQLRYRGKGIYFGFPKQSFPLRCLEREISDFPTGGSVITCMFSFLYEAGFRKFILTGEDLAYSEGGKAHSGSIEDTVTIKDYMWDGYYGGKVCVREDWKIMLEFFEQQLLRHKDISLVDATEGGAYIHGSRNMRLVDAINEMEECYPVDKWLTDIPDRSNKEDESKEIREFFDSLKKQCERNQELLSALSALNGSMAGELEKDDPDEEYLLQSCEEYDLLYEELMNEENDRFFRDHWLDIIIEYEEKIGVLTDDANMIDRLLTDADMFYKLSAVMKESERFIDELI